MAVPYGVEEAVYGRPEGAWPHGVPVDHVDAELEADQVGRLVADRPCGELVDHGVTGQPEVEQVGTGQPGGHHRPGAQWALGLTAVADRTAVVHPARPVPPRGLADRAVGSQGDQLDLAGVRQPDLDLLQARWQ